MKIKIVNVKKFFLNCTILLGIIVICGVIFTNKSYSKTEEVYKNEIIVQGETLWGIAKNEKNNNDYYKDKDVRYIVYDLQQINNLSNTNLLDGQEIIIPTYK
mgnify:FL=1